MSEGTIGLIVIAVFVAVLLFGFLFGLWRGFNKSLVRLLLVVASIVGAFFLAPVVTKWALTFDLSNFGIRIGSEPVKNLGELLTALLKDVPYIQDLAETDAYNIILTVVPPMIANVVLFLLLFYIIRLISMIIYWIIAGICFSKKKTEGKSKHRLLGSLVGVVQNFAVFLVLLVPIVGAVNIVGEVERIVTEEQSSTEASTARTTISDDESYVVLMDSSEEEEEAPASSSSGPEGAIVKIYNTVNDVIRIYKNTWVAKFLNSVKLDAICQGAFDKLSTVEKDGVKYELKNEVASVAYVYTDYKAFKELGELDVTNPKLYDIMKSAIEHAYKSKIASAAIDEIIPLAAGEWYEGRPFLGITFDSLNIQEPYDAVVKSALGVLSSREESLLDTLTSTADMMKSLAGTVAKVQEAMEDGLNALTPETVTDLLTTLTESEDAIELVSQVLLTEDPEDEDNRNNLEKLTDKLFGDSDEEKVIKGAVVEIVTEVLEGATNPDVDTSKEIAVVGAALDLADKIMNSDGEETEITPDVVKEAVSDVVTALVESTVIYNAITGESDLAKVVQEQIAGYTEEDEDGHDISYWINEVLDDAGEGVTDDDTLAKLDAIRDLLIPTTSGSGE